MSHSAESSSEETENPRGSVWIMDEGTDGTEEPTRPRGSGLQGQDREDSQEGKIAKKVHVALKQTEERIAGRLQELANKMQLLEQKVSLSEGGESGNNSGSWEIRPDLEERMKTLEEFLKQALESSLPKAFSLLADLEERSSVGDPHETGRALVEAAEEGSAEEVQALVNKGAPIDAFDVNKDTALHLAAFGAHLDVAAVLLQAGADVHARNVHGETALHLASFRDCSGRCVELLLRAGGDVAAASNEGWTPLHLAAAHGNARAVVLLGQAGADTAARNNKNQTPGDLSVDAEIDLLMRLLTTMRALSTYRSTS